MSENQKCEACQQLPIGSQKSGWKKLIAGKTFALYFTMVLVSTLAIYFLEHASLLNAIRTAFIAAIGKTFAAT